MVTAITRYQASDGAIFESENAAKVYEGTLPLKALIASYAADSKPWTTETILLVVIRHAEEFIRLLAYHLEIGPFPTPACKEALRQSWEEFLTSAKGEGTIDIDLVIRWLARNRVAIIKILLT